MKGSEVKLGDRLGANVEILDGVQPGATVVADGVEAMTDGLLIAPRKTPPSGGRQ